MKVAIYSRTFTEDNQHVIQKILRKTTELNAEVTVYEPFYMFLKDKIDQENITTFTTHEDIRSSVDYLISIGGDGTLLDTTTLIRDSGIPIVGVNTGRLGYLSSIDLADIDQALDLIFKGDYTLDQRTLLKVETTNNIFGQDNFALNELTIHKKDTSSMVTIHAYMNGEYLNSYWADGLIIATPTGSTAYSMSCGGPIVLSGSNNFEITPIAPHNLNVRPLIIPDNKILTLKVEGRSESFMCSLDSRSETIGPGVELRVSRNNFKINLLRLKSQNELQTIRKKLNWGLDTRN